MCILTDKITVASFCFVYLVDSILSCEDSQNPANTSDRCRVLWFGNLQSFRTLRFGLRTYRSQTFSKKGSN